MRGLKTAFVAVLLAAGVWACEDDPEEPGVVDELPEGMVEEYVAEGFVPVDWERTELEEFDEATGRVVMETAEGSVPVFEAGNSLVVDDGTEAYIRRVTAVEMEGGRVMLETEQGDMGDVFRNVAFVLSGELTGRAMSRSADGCLRFHPVSVTTRDAEGVSRTWEASRSGELVAGDSVYERSWDYSGETLFELGGASVVFEDCHLSMRLLPYLYFDFGEREVKDSVGLGKAFMKGWLRDFECCFDGTVDWALVPTFAYTQEFSAEKEKTLENVLPEMTMRFMVFGVPVVVTIGTDLVGEVSCKANASVSVTGGIEGELVGRLGFGVRNIGGGASLEPIGELEENRAELVPLTITAQGSAEGTLYVYPQWRVKLYSVLGPTVALGNGLEAECGWGMMNEVVERHAGLDFLTKLRCSLDYKVLIWKGTIGKQGEWTLDSTALYETPAALEFVPGGEESVDVGDTVSATFRVDAAWFESEGRPVGEDYYVYYETENVSEPWSVTDGEGMVTVDWSPQSVDEKLVAVVYGKDFEVVVRDTADIVVKGKRVSRIVRRCDDGFLTNYSFSYDEEGRLERIVTENWNIGTTDRTTFTYAEDHVTVRESYTDAGVADSYTVTIQLDENGRATESEVSHGEHYSYSYDEDGYLSNVEWYGNNRLTVVDGDLTHVRRDGYSNSITVGNALNNANIDLYYFVCFWDFVDDSQAMYLGLTGRRFKHLPSRITNSDHDGDTPLVLSYSVDEDGNVTCITERSVGVDGYYAFDIYYE